MRPDVDGDPTNYTEKVWLYRYNDFGFLKAGFDPASVEAIISADSDIYKLDDILGLADTEPVGEPGKEKPLIFYASQWYTYYNPYVLPIKGIPPCYDEEPFVGSCDPLAGYDGIDEWSPFGYMPTNFCDGQALWATSADSDEMHTDPDCSEFMKQGCGWCFARYGCVTTRLGACQDPLCDCDALGFAVDEEALTQMGIPGAQPRFRKYLIKTSRVRGSDGEMHQYRFDYLGAASGVYESDQRIRSYADPHNITIVDELVDQTADERAGGSADRSDFYIYEDDFRFSLDATGGRSEEYATDMPHRASSHYLHVPVKVKTRRVVTMNYYGIALSDRLILTPGFPGDHTSFVDGQQYELINRRGQAKHVYPNVA